MKNSITGTEALERMRQIKAQPQLDFGLVFITFQRGRKFKGSEVTKYERCRLRSAMRSEGLEVDSDHYLYFTDMERMEARQCWKKLIRQVRFGNNWYQVKWFNNE